MKHTFTALSALFFSFLFLAVFLTEKQDQPVAKTAETSPGYSIKGRALYDWKRLADPTGKIPMGMRKAELAFASTLPTDVALASSRMQTSAVFQPRGPWNVGGRTRAVAMDVMDENIMIAGSTSGGIWRTADGGATWTKITEPGAYHGITCVVQDTRPGETNTWYTGSGEAYGQSASGSGPNSYFMGNGMMKSVDNGLSWTPVTSTVSNSPQTYQAWDMIWNIQLDPTDTADIIYAALLGNIYKSVNGGSNWSPLFSTGAYFTDVMVTPAGVVYATLSSDGASASKGIFRSDDGITFANITPSGFPLTYNRIVMGYAPSDETQVYFLANTPGAGTPDTNFVGTVEWNSLWKYTYLNGNGSGAGGNWEDRSGSLPTTGGVFDKFSSQGSYDMVVKVKPDDPNTVFIGGTNLYRSTNGFLDATQTTFIGGYEEGGSLPLIPMYQNHHPDQHGLIFSPSDPSVMISITDGGIFKTMDNMASQVNWISLNNGYLTTMFYTVAMDHASTNDILLAGAQDNGTWYTNNSTLTSPWVMPRGGDGSYCAIADNNAAYYMSIQNGKMMKANLDGSGNLLNYARIDPVGGKNYQFINPYVLDPNDNNIMYLAGGKYLWRNDSLNTIPMVNNWDTISYGWTQFPDSVSTANVEITAVAVSKVPANVVYYGTSKKKVYKVVNANSGAPSSIDITPLAFPGTGYVSCVAVDPANADHVLVVFSNYSVYSLWGTRDGGITWTKEAGNLEQYSSGSGNGPSLRWASIIPVADGTIYLLASSTGVYATDTLMELNTVWVQQGAATLGSVVCDMIDYRTSDGLVAVATHANGIYSTHLLSVNDIATATPSEIFAAEDVDVFPNPATEAASVRLRNGNSKTVELFLLDNRGRKVRNIYSGKITGDMEFRIERNGLPSGIYFIAGKSGKAIFSRKLVFTR